MAYLILQIVVCLLLAALLGGLAGWLLRGRPQAPDDPGALDAATRRIADLERELAESRQVPPGMDEPAHGGGLAASPAGPISPAGNTNDGTL
ncbi:MAG TPA: hypothetical protein VF594_07430 [Rubricoccaceae bacterium]